MSYLTPLSVARLYSAKWMDEMERIWKEGVVAYLIICLEWLRKTTENLRQDRRRPGRDSNLLFPEYEQRVLLLHQPAL
jgi:hypothetical protein